MPKFIDVHKGVEGVTAEVLAGAHQKDLEVQKRYDVKYLNYWFDPQEGTIFCLSEAPNKEAAEAVHRESHGMVADEIYEVIEGSTSTAES